MPVQISFSLALFDRLPAVALRTPCVWAQWKQLNEAEVLAHCVVKSGLGRIPSKFALHLHRLKNKWRGNLLVSHSSNVIPSQAVKFCGA